VPLWCGAGDAAAAERGRVDTHDSPLFNRFQRALLPVAAHPVTRTLSEGDVVEGFEVLEVPGHSPGSLAFWRVLTDPGRFAAAVDQITEGRG
jgi:hydroxyacylglutathione hydrolase